MRYAASEAYFSVKEIDLAIVADVGTLQRLPKLVPEGIARELAYTGRRFDAAEAREIGLVNRVYDSAASLRMAWRKSPRQSRPSRHCRSEASRKSPFMRATTPWPTA